jgi:Flp pilus assembly protein TadG
MTLPWRTPRRGGSRATIPKAQPLDARSRRSRSRGQTLVEFALILPVFLLLTLGVVDGARIFTAYIAITNGAREGALYASAGGSYSKWCSTTSTVVCPTGWAVSNQSNDPDNIAFRVQAETQGLTQLNIILLPPTCDTTPCNSSSTKVTVQVKYSMSLFVPVVGALMGSPLVMTASTTAVIQ